MRWKALQQLQSFLGNLAVKEYWKSVYTCRSYDQKSSVLFFFETRCILMFYCCTNDMWTLNALCVKLAPYDRIALQAYWRVNSLAYLLPHPLQTLFYNRLPHAVIMETPGGRAPKPTGVPPFRVCSLGLFCKHGTFGGVESNLYVTGPIFRHKALEKIGFVPHFIQLAPVSLCRSGSLVGFTQYC